MCAQSRLWFPFLVCWTLSTLDSLAWVPSYIPKRNSEWKNKQGIHVMTKAKQALATGLKCKLVIALCRGEFLLKKVQALFYVCTQPPSIFFFRFWCRYWKHPILHWGYEKKFPNVIKGHAIAAISARIRSSALEHKAFVLHSFDTSASEAHDKGRFFRNDEIVVYSSLPRCLGSWVSKGRTIKM